MATDPTKTQLTDEQRALLAKQANARFVYSTASLESATRESLRESRCENCE